MMLGIIFFGGLFLFYHHALDGVYINRALTFTQGVDPLNMQTVKPEYKRGEMVQIYTSFCKNRESIAVTQWALANSTLTFYAPSPTREVPLGCYPEEQDRLYVVDVKPVPDDAHLGSHFFYGVTTHTFPDGRQRKQEYRTVTFNVIE